jgi:hypothetical protein
LETFQSVFDGKVVSVA